MIEGGYEILNVNDDSSPPLEYVDGPIPHPTTLVIHRHFYQGINTIKLF